MSTDDIHRPPLDLPNGETDMSYGYDPAASTETFPEAHPMIGVQREPSSALTVDSNYPFPSTPQREGFPIPAPAGGLRQSVGPYGAKMQMSPGRSEPRRISLQDPGYIVR